MQPNSQTKAHYEGNRATKRGQQSRKRARTPDDLDSDNDLDNETWSKTPNAGADARHNGHNRSTPFGAGALFDAPAFTAMLTKMISNPSDHQELWLDRTALFLPDGGRHQLMVTVTDSQVHSTKASFQLTAADGRVW